MPKPLARFSPVLDSLNQAESPCYETSPYGINSPRHFNFPKSSNIPPPCRSHTFPPSRKTRQYAPQTRSPPTMSRHTQQAAPVFRLSPTAPTTDTGYRASRFTEDLLPGTDSREVLLAGMDSGETSCPSSRTSETAFPSMYRSELFYVSRTSSRLTQFSGSNASDTISLSESTSETSLPPPGEVKLSSLKKSKRKEVFGRLRKIFRDR